MAKCSDIVSKLDPEVVKKFDVKGVMYVRYLPDKSRSDYMPWQHQFYTDDRKVIQLGSHQESHVRIDCTLKAKNKIVEILKKNDDFQSPVIEFTLMTLFTLLGSRNKSTAAR